jgi:threonine aldolase
MMEIDLRSDTVTKPTPGMLEAMMNAKVGDDVFNEDPTVIELENRLAEMFGMEAGIFCPSGTMTNQIAIKIHTQPGDEVICDYNNHVYRYEGGGIASNSGASVRLIHGDKGRFTAQDVLENINNSEDVHLPITSLVSVENTSNRGGGCCYDMNELQKISEVCKLNGLKFHLDGARLFNAIVANGESPKQYGKMFDSISICLSKGLGVPVGSVLIGSKSDIKTARRIRKVLGGGMRQAGFLAAAGIYAIENNIDRLSEDHKRAQDVKSIVEQLDAVEEVFPVETNIVILKLKASQDRDEYIAQLLEKGIKVVAFGPRLIRMTLHLDITDEMIVYLKNSLI